MSPLIKRVVVGFIGLAAIVLGGALGYYTLGAGQWSYWDCVYMTVITVTTVGYSETLEGMDKIAWVREYTVVLLLFGTGAIVYFASTITAFIIEGDLKNVLFTSRLKKRMKRMKDHVVVCGAGATGRNVIEEMLKTGVPVIAVDFSEPDLKEIADKYPKAEFSFLVGDATDDDILAAVNLSAARGLVAVLPSDKDNLYLAVSARQISSTVRVVARCSELSHVEKMKRAGADAVVSPNYIGGMRLVSEMVRPSVVKFLDDMLRDKRAAYRIEDIDVGNIDSLGATLAAAKIHERFGMNVLALRIEKAGTWTYNPVGDEKILPGSTLVVLGSPDQVAALRKVVT